MKQSCITVRVLHPETDWQAFRAMRLRAIENHPDAFSEPLDAARQAPEQLWRSKWLGEGRQNVRAIGGYVDGALSGIVVVIPYWGDPDGRTGYMVSLYVADNARGTGLVDALYAACIAHAKTVTDWDKLWLGHYVGNPRAIAVSKRHGFVLVGGERETNSGGVENDVEQYGMTLK